MAIADLELFKKHVRADDFTEDDDYLQHLLQAAEDWVVMSTHRTEAELADMGGGKVPVPIVQAVLMLAAHWYNQREAVAAAQMYEVPGSLQSLIKPYRKLANDDSGTNEIQN